MLGHIESVTPPKISHEKGRRKEEQLLIDFGKPVEVPRVQGATIQERFESFHRLNPWVFDALEKLARTYLAAGRSQVGMKHLCEILRWEYFKATQGDDFRINNNWTSRYARLLIQKHPEFDSVLELRRLRA